MGYWVLATAILPWVPVFPIPLHSFKHEPEKREIEEKDG